MKMLLWVYIGQRCIYADVRAGCCCLFGINEALLEQQTKAAIEDLIAAKVLNILQSSFFAFVSSKTTPVFILKRVVPNIVRIPVDVQRPGP